ncbi:uncharacterized protein LOC115620652 [Scaptodrosophila lebanonensis]|uniref:Uncharacterized protein LOC115620652 n=1 Tax=Drosophila lebanonensis TaxID=7225 RepID=A0A6J2SZ53_DROLE|nr:uncharacterized protein LOC115620652 [Scaptodrosophila lebanonensis]
MLSKMAQPNNSGGSGGGRRAPMSLNAGGPVARAQQQQQQLSGSNGRSNSPQNSNAARKSEPQQAGAPFVAIKDFKKAQQQHAPSPPVLDDKKGSNGVSKPPNVKEKVPQNSNNTTTSKEEVKKDQKSKDKGSDKKESKADTKRDPTDENTSKPKKDSEKETIQNLAAVEHKNTKFVEKDDDVIVIESDNVVGDVPTTPTSDRKSARKAASQQKSPSSKQNVSPAPKKPPQPETIVSTTADVTEDVVMEPLTVDASPIKNLANVASSSNTQPAATSTPGRSNLFGFRSSKQTNEVELAAQPSNSPPIGPPRSFAQITGRRSIRPMPKLTPAQLESYRSINSELDVSSCTNASMNATVGSEIPNSSSFSFSFFGRGRKRERTPPPLTGSQSATDLAQDLSPPKRARFELFNINLASPFTMLRTRFSKASISTPSRLQLDQTPPAGDEEGEVQNVSGIVIEEEEQLNTSAQPSANEENKGLTIGQEAGLDTPTKSGTTQKDVGAEQVEGDASGQHESAEILAEGEGINRSRCSIM